MPVTVPKSEADLLAYFRNGDKPNEDQFEELISTMFYRLNQATTAAAAAQAAADAANAKQGARAFAKSKYVVSPAAYTDLTIFGCTGARTTGSGNTLFTFTFTTPFLDAEYVLSYKASVNFASVTRNAASIIFTFTGVGSHDVEFVIFKQ